MADETNTFNDRTYKDGAVMAVKSKEKGKRFERTLAGKLREYGYKCRRGQQYCGLEGNADVVGLPYIHIEAKAVERLNIYDAMAQAKSDAKEGELPTVFHKKNNHAILVTMEFDDWMKLYTEFEAGKVVGNG